MIRDLILEAKADKIEDLSAAVSSEPYFIFFMGATGSGKNYIAQQYIPDVPLVDIDKYMAELALEYGTDERKHISRAVAIANKQLKKYFDEPTSVVQTGTGGNLKGLENKIKLAKSKGMKTAIVLVDTDIKKAKERNISRAAAGAQRLVPDWKIDVSYKASKVNYRTLQKEVDFFAMVKN